MKNLLKALVLSAVLMLLSGCPLFSPQDGSITIVIRGGESLIGSPFRYTVTVEGEDPPVTGSAPLTAGVTTISVDGGRTFTGGTDISIDGFIDTDDSGGDPIGGVDYETVGIYESEVDGEVEAAFDYPDDFYLSQNGNALLALFEDADCIDQIYASKDLGTGYLDLEMHYEYTIKNHGSALMTLDGTPLVRFTGPGGSAFTITGFPDETQLKPAETTSFSFTVGSSVPGSYGVILTIPYHDSSATASNTNMTVTIAAPAVSIPKTGETDSQLAGDDGDLETGTAWPEPRFTDHEDGTVTDNLTGLMWQGAPPYYASGYEWRYATTNYLTARNDESYCGYDDWHLPNVRELYSLVHAGQSSTASWLNSHDGFSGVRNDEYWSSTMSYGSYSTSGWAYVVNLGSGKFFRQNVSNYGSFAMIILVREASAGTSSLPRTGRYTYVNQGDDGYLRFGVPWPSPRFLITGGTVYDALTGLQWKQDPYPAPVNWDDALTYAASLEYAGYSDWRLPNRNEMLSLPSYGVSSNDAYIATSFSTEVPEEKFWWTSTSSAADSTEAWVFYLDNGRSPDSFPKTELKYCWVVRNP